MRIRTFLATVTLTALVTGAAGLVGPAAYATMAPTSKAAGAVTVWGASTAATDVPTDLPAVADVAVGAHSTAVVTSDGDFRIWGPAGRAEIENAPTGVTDASAVALSDSGGDGYGLLLQANGTVTGWGGNAPLDDVPEGLQATAIAANGGTGYAVLFGSGKLVEWGAEPSYAHAPGTSNLVDVAAGTQGALALAQGGTVVAWGESGLPGDPFNTVPDLGGKQAVQIAVGPGYNGVVLADGTVRIWGPGAPENQPDFTGKKVKSLSLSTSAAAVVEDNSTGELSVELWGPEADALNAPEHETALDGLPIAKVAMGSNHAAALTAFRKVTEASFSGSPAVAPKVGQTLTATPATFSLAPDEAVGRWLVGETSISGQPDTTLVIEGWMVGMPISYRTTATRGDRTLTSRTLETAPVTIGTSTTVLTVSPATAVVGTARTVTATVTRADGTPTGTVTFTAGTRSRNVILEEGKATWKPSFLTAGNTQITATYNGSPSSTASTATPVTIKVTQATSKVRASAKASKRTNKATITINVTTTKAVSHAGKVTITLKGKTKKTVTVKVGSDGKATVTIKKVKRGSYKVSLKYLGNRDVSGSNGSAKFKF